MTDLLPDIIRGNTKTYSFIFTEQGKAIRGISKANPGVVTVYKHGYSTSDICYLRNKRFKTGVVNDLRGMDQLDCRSHAGRHFTITSVDSNNVSIGEDTSAYNAWESGGEIARAVDLYGSTIKLVMRNMSTGSTVVTNTYTPADDATSSRGAIDCTLSSTDTELDAGTYRVEILKTESGSPDVDTSVVFEVVVVDSPANPE